MDIPPCTTGTHSTTDKPPQLDEKPQDDAAALAKKIDALTASSAATAPGRAPVQTPEHAPTPPPPPPETDDDEASLAIPEGAECRRRTCGQKYKNTGATREGEQCVHHPGVPIFHEGSKGYSCCRRRVLEFDQFMKLEGCQTKGRHLFIGSGKREKANAKAAGHEVLDTVR